MSAHPGPESPTSRRHQSAVEVHHEVLGPPGAPALVLSGSVATTLRLWDAQVPELARRYRVVRYDHRGHGRSPVPPGPYRIDDLVADVLALLDRLDIATASFCGLSLGGMVGMRLAAEAPERLDRLILCCTAPHLPPGLWDERMAVVREHGTAAIADATIARWFPSAFRESAPAEVARVAAMVADTPNAGYLGCCQAMAEMDLRADLSRIRARTLVVAGERDPATPVAAAEAIADAVRAGSGDARTAVLTGAGHLAPVERPAAFTRLLLEHLGG